MQSLRQLSCASNKNKSHHHHQSSTNRQQRDETSSKNSKARTTSSQRSKTSASNASAAISPPTTTSSNISSSTATAATLPKAEVVHQNPTRKNQQERQEEEDNAPSFASSDDTNVVVGLVDSKTGVITAIGSHHHHQHHTHHDDHRRNTHAARERSASATPHEDASKASVATVAVTTIAAAIPAAAPIACVPELQLVDNNSSRRSSSVPRNRTLEVVPPSLTTSTLQPQPLGTGCFSDSEATTSHPHQHHHTLSTASIPTATHGLHNGDVRRPLLAQNLAQKESVQTILDQLFRTHTANHHHQQQALMGNHNKQTPIEPPLVSPVPTHGSSSQLDELDIVHNILNIPALRSLLRLHDALSSDESNLASNQQSTGQQQQQQKQQQQKQAGAVLLPPPPPPPVRTKSSMSTQQRRDDEAPRPPPLRASSSSHLADEIIHSIGHADTAETLPQNDFWLDAADGNSLAQLLTTVTLPLQNDALNIAEHLCEQVRRRQTQNAARRNSSFDLDAVEESDVDVDEPAKAHQTSTLYVRTVPSLHAAPNPPAASPNVGDENTGRAGPSDRTAENAQPIANNPRISTASTLRADMKYMTAQGSTDTAETASSTANTNETGSSTMTDDVMQALGEEDEEEHEAEKQMLGIFSSATNFDRQPAAPNADSLFALDTSLQLQTLLQSDNFRALLRAHDAIARRDYGPPALDHNACMIRPAFHPRSKPPADTTGSTSPLPLLPPPPPPPSTLTTFVANKITTFPSAAPYATIIGPTASSTISSSTTIRSNSRPMNVDNNAPRPRGATPGSDAMRVSCSNEEIKSPIQFASVVGPSPLLPPPPPVLSKHRHHYPHERSGSAGRPITADNHLRNSERAANASGVQLLTRSATVTAATTSSTNETTRRQHQSVHWQNEPTTFSSPKYKRTEVNLQRPVDIAYDVNSSASTSATNTTSGTLTTNTDEEDVDDENTVAMRCVRLVRTNEPLGATIRRDERTGSIVIARVFPGGAAQRSGLMRPGDVLLEVNNMPVKGLDPRQVVHLIAQCKGTISFRLLPSAISTTPQDFAATTPFSSQAIQTTAQQQQQLPTSDSYHMRNSDASDRYESVIGVVGTGQQHHHLQQSNYANVIPHPSVAQRTRMLVAQHQTQKHQHRSHPDQHRQHSQPLFREVVMQQQRRVGCNRSQPQSAQAEFIHQPTQNAAPSGSEYFVGSYQQQQPQPIPSMNSNSSLVRMQQMPNSQSNLWTPMPLQQQQQQRSTRSVEFLPPPRVLAIAPARPRRFMRAHFDFDPELDNLVPNRDEGLPFKRGDILEIIDDFASDLNWWRARLIQTSHSCTNMGATTATTAGGGPSTERSIGYVPAKQLQERRMLAQRRQQILNGTHYYCKIHGYSTWPHGRRPERRAAQQQPQTAAESSAAAAAESAGTATAATTFQSVHSDELDRADIITYESVSLLEPGSVGGYGFNVRPIVIIGPPGVGKNELRARLIQMNSERFQTTIPHTSRPVRPNEREGDEYHFVTRADMEQRIKQGNFLEWGEYEGNLYGTSLDEVSKCMRRGTVCVLVIHPSAVRRIRTAEYMPFIIYVQPPSLERLRETRMAARARSTFDERLLRGFTEHEFRYILSYAERMESQYSHVFDAVIVNDNLALAFAQLKSLVYALDREPQWVPTVWLSQRDDIVGNAFVRHQQHTFVAPQAPPGIAGADTGHHQTQQLTTTHGHPQHHHLLQSAAVAPQHLVPPAASLLNQ